MSRGMNTYSCSGNLASDVNYGQTGIGDLACNFKLAIEEAHRRLVFIRVNLYKDGAEICKKMSLQKGDYVVISGELMNRRGRNNDDTLVEVRGRTIVVRKKIDGRRNGDGEAEEREEGKEVEEAREGRVRE